MKLVLGIICLAVAALQAKAEVSAFALDQEYEYIYNGRVATGIADDVKQFSGFGTKGKLIIQNQGNYLYVKLKDVEIGRGNERYEGDMRDEFEYNYSVPKGPVADVKDQLEKPIRVILENGLVKSFDAYPDDAEWSINIKRAVLSLFQTNFDNINSVRKTKSNYVLPENQENIYRVMEEGIGGECETIYEFLHKPNPKNPYARVMNVTKHRLYDKCNDRPHYMHSDMQGYKCTECEKEGNLPLKSLSRVDYQITGDRYHFTINRIYSTGFITFTPFTSYGQTVISGANQTLELMEQRAIQTPITIGSNPVTYKSLAYTFPYNRRNPDEVDLTKAHHYNRQYEHTHENYREEAKKLLTEMEPKKATEDKLADAENHHITDKMLEMIRVLTMFNYEDFMALEKENMDKYGMYMVLPYVGTNPSILYLKYVVENVPKQNIWPKVISRVPFYVKEPSEKLINEFHTLLDLPKVKSNPELYSTAVLAYGTLVHKGCVHTFTNPHPGNSKTFVKHDICMKYAKELYQKIIETTEESKRLLYLSALSNTKIPETFQYFKELIDGHYGHQVRLSAMWGLAELLPELKHEVIALLNPIFHDYTEDYVSRIYAFSILMMTEPSPTFINYMVESLQGEPNRQVASYMYSTFLAIANSTFPCDKKMAKHIELALQFVEPQEYHGMKYSRTKVFSYFNEKHNFGRMTHFEWIGANNSVIPREMYLRQAFTLLGYNFDLMEIGLYSEGTDALTSKMFGPDGQYSPYDHNKSMFNLLRRATRDVKEMEKEREEIKEKLHIEDRDDEPFKAEFYMKLYNQNVKMSFMDEKVLKNFFEKGYVSLPEAMMKQFEETGFSANFESVLTLTDILLEIPNDMGFPVTLDLKLPAVMNVWGKLKTKVEPSIFPEDRGFKKPTSVILEPHMTVDYDYKLQAYMGVTSPFHNTYGYGITTRGTMQFPIHGKIEYDLMHKKMKVNYIPSKESYDMLYYKTEPFTFIADKSKFVPIDEQRENLLPVHYLEAPVEKHRTYSPEFFGIGLDVSAKYDYYWNDYGSYRSFAKSFFKKSTNYDDYYYWADRYYAGTKGMCDYTILNPTFKPFEYKVKYIKSKSNPTNEFEYTIDFDYKRLAKDQEYSEDHPEVVIPEVTMEKEVYGMHIDIVGKGNTERHWKLDYEVDYDYTAEETVRKNHLKYERSALPEYDSEEYKVCYEGQAKYPSFGKTYFGELNEHPKVEYEAKLNFGRNCDNDKEITLKAIVDQSEEQKEYISKHKEDLPYYRQCEKDLKASKGKLGYSRACWRLRDHLARLDHLKLDLEYKGIPDYIKNYTMRMSSYLRHYFYDNLEINPFAENQENHIKVEANFSYVYPVVDIKVYKPHENVYFNKIFVPALFPIYEPYSATQNAKDKYMKKLWGKTYGFCSMTDEYVRTFDNVTYDAHLSNCYHLVAKDCSKKSSYAVLVKKVNDDAKNKALKAYFGNHKLEIIPEGGHMVVRVDGEVHNMNNNDKYVVYDKENKDKMMFYVVYKWEKFFIYSKVYGVKIFFDGTNAKIMISKFYRGNQCGICGNYDGEATYEFEGPDGCHYYQPQNFVNSYAMPDGTCQVPEYEKKCEIKHSDDCIMKMNRHVYMGKGEGSRKVCFTTRPLNECKPGCKPTDMHKETVGFHCLEAQDDFTRSLVRESKTRELTEIKTKTEDFTRDVQVPEHCVPY